MIKSYRKSTALVSLALLFLVSAGLYQLAFSGDEPGTAEKYEGDRTTWNNLLQDEPELLKQQQYAALANRYRKNVDNFETETFKTYSKTRAESWKTTNRFFAKFIGWINRGTDAIKSLKINNLELKPGSANRSRVQMERKGIKLPKKWTEILNEENDLLSRMLDLENVKTPRNRYELGLFLVLNGFDTMGNKLLAKVYKNGEQYKKKLNSFFAMQKLVHVPEDGFIVFNNRVVTEAEKKKLEDIAKKAESDKWVKYKGEYIRKEEYMRKTGKVKYKGKWMSKEKKEKLKKRERKKRLQRMVKFDLKFAVVPDAPKKKLKDLEKRIRKASKLLYEISYGQMVFRNITIMDNTSKRKGDVFIPSLTEYVGPRTGKGQTRIFFDFSPVLLIHEFGHLKLDLPDEYKQVSGKRKTICNACIMGQLDDPKFCDSSNHTDSGASCWDKMLKKFDKLKYDPKMAKKTYDNPPEPNITIKDN